MLKREKVDIATKLMTNTKISRVMLSTLVTGGLAFMMFSGTVLLADRVEAPVETKRETQIESSSDLVSFGYRPIEQKPSLEEIRLEGEKRVAEQIAKVEAEKKKRQEIHKRLEAERKTKEESYVQSTDGIEFNGSYYTAFCREGCIGITATGYDVSKTIYYEDMRVVAVDPKVIPLNSILEVSTPYETFKAIALDTGGAIKGRKIDILVTDTETAKELGRHSVYVKVIENERNTF